MSELASEDFKARLGSFVDGRRAEVFITTVILANAVVLGLETSRAIMDRWGDLLRLADQVMLAIFVLELAAKAYVHRSGFHRDGWRVFDTIVVGIALVPAAGPFAVLRALRVLRVLRLITMVPSMRKVVAGLLAAIPGIGSIMSIMVLMFYVAAVIATKLFGEAFPQWFGTLFESAYTLFQVMTLESWSMGIVRPVMERFPYAWAFFVPYILLATFTMLNLFIAVIVNAMQSEAQADRLEIESQASDERGDIRSDVASLRDEIVALRNALRESRPG